MSVSKKQGAYLVGLVLLSFTLEGCGDSLAKLSRTQPIGAPLTVALAQEYLIFASREKTTYYDKVSASYFAQKGLDAAMGAQVEPEHLEKWHIPMGLQGEMQQARARLLAAINGSTPKANNANELAQAQVSYDCWLEEQDENRQPENIAFCRNNFYQAVAVAEQKNIIISPMLLPTQPYRTYYRPGQTDVPQQAGPVLNQLMMLIKQVQDYKMTVDGYADRTGKSAKNLIISEQRANKMRDAVVARGAIGEKIRTFGHGDSGATGKKGVPNGQDRRVDITLYVPEDDLINMAPDVAQQNLSEGMPAGLNTGGIFAPPATPLQQPSTMPLMTPKQQ